MQSNEEIWKDIPSYEGYYQVSNFGRVRSLDRTKFGNNKNIIPVLGQIMRPSIDKKGYKRAMLSKVGKRTGFLVSRLVAIVFIPNPENKAEVNHIDSNPMNNLVSNLEWATREENNNHRIKHGIHLVGSNSPNVLLKEADVIEMRRLYRNGIKMSLLMSTYKISKKGAYYAVTGVNWKSINHIEPPCLKRRKQNRV